MFRILPASMYLLFLMFLCSCSDDGLQEDEMEEIIITNQYENLKSECHGDSNLPEFWAFEISTETSTDSQQTIVKGLASQDVVLDENQCFGPDLFGKYARLEVKLSGDTLFVQTEELGINLFISCNYVFLREE